MSNSWQSKVRSDFPILSTKVYNRPLVYFDNAATTQKPKQVIQAITDYYEKENCNIHRGVHYLSVKATEAYEDTRSVIRDFIHARHSHEIIFTRGTTESINLVADSFGKKFLSEGDEVIISVMEHHSNFVPWQQMCLERKATLRFIPLLEDGSLDIPGFCELITEKTRLVALTHISNVLGTINPVKEIIAVAHQHGIPVLIDGAQAVAHSAVDVQELDADFYCFSGHKMYAPMGIGVLYGKEHWLEELPPYQMGGEMIRDVYFTHTTFNELPFKFEAGTPNVEGAMGLHAAIRYLREIGMDRIEACEQELLDYATRHLLGIGGLKIFGTAPHKASLISFLLDTIHPYDAGMIIDKMGVAVRTGHHCAMPLMEYLKIPGTIRASFAFYNTKEEVDRLVEAVEKAKEMLL
ncbi:MAG: cysteine desulfurase [Bacteroidetes bacterium]|nr:MAG: cysteine desulfurase [Bacteroidota bacterium]